MRLDQYLEQHLFCETRNKAQQLIRANKVLVNGKIVNSKGYEVKAGDEVSLVESDVLKFVSRAGHKLEKAIDEFQLSFQDKVICDIGSSTGGFTDCALQHGAKKVYAIDVGSSQLHDSLRGNPKIIVRENTNFRNVTMADFSEPIDIYVCDVSFISAREILKTLFSFHQLFRIILLFKPQFEIGPGKLNDRGVVSQTDDLVESLCNFQAFLEERGMKISHVTYSPILGSKEGNIEFLFDISSAGAPFSWNPSQLVRKALKALR